jgi:3-isopropylmalate dehydrogenase
MVVFRENTEGAYTPGEFRLERGVNLEFVISPTVITAHGAERVAREAFQLAARRHGSPSDGIKRVTCVDKSNVVRAHRFFRDIFRSVAKEFPEIVADFAYVDAFAHALITRPERYDVVVAPNLPGDIITDLGSALQGGMGMAASGNLGEHHAMFEPIHGSAPDIAGKGIANPIAAIMSASMMLRWLGERHEDTRAIRAATLIDDAIAEVLKDQSNHTADLGGTSSTQATGDALLRTLEAKVVSL